MLSMEKKKNIYSDILQRKEYYEKKIGALHLVVSEQLGL